MIEELVLELFSGRLALRQSIVDQVLQTHLARGGTNPVVQDFPRSVKKALSALKERGLADNPSFGYWKIDGGNSANEPVESVVDPNSSGAKAETFECVEMPQPEAIADRVIGVGNSAVYLYYLPVYRLLAEHNHQKVWPCKIGRTDRDPKLRILAQAATALPERPHIALVVRTQTPIPLEAAIHNILTFRGRNIDNSPGSEWFLTSPEEVTEIVSFIKQAAPDDEAESAVRDQAQLW